MKPFFISPGVTENETKRKTLVERNYHNCYQRVGEDDKSFYDRLKLAADAMTQLGEAYAIPESDRARHYLMRLQGHHADMVASLLNDAATTPLPATLAAAYTKTVAWVKAARRPGVMEDRRVPTAYTAVREDNYAVDDNYDDYDGEKEDYIWDDQKEEAYVGRGGAKG